MAAINGMLMVAEGCWLNLISPYKGRSAARTFEFLLVLPPKYGIE
jgi:hypothetical protein